MNRKTGSSPGARWVVMALLASLASGCSTPEPPFGPAHRQAVADSVRSFLDGYVDAVHGQRWSEVTGLYSGDDRFRILENGRVAYRTRADAVASIEGMAAAFPEVALELTETHIVPLAPGVAGVHATFAQSFTSTEGRSVEIEGALSMTVVHEEGGWRILTGHSSSLRPDPDESP